MTTLFADLKALFKWVAAVPRYQLNKGNDLARIQLTRQSHVQRQDFCPHLGLRLQVQLLVKYKASDSVPNLVTFQLN